MLVHIRMLKFVCKLIDNTKKIKLSFTYFQNIEFGILKYFQLSENQTKRIEKICSMILRSMKKHLVLN